MKKLLPLLLILSLGTQVIQAQNHNNQKLLLISFDGFRSDYLTKTDTPNFDALVKQGVISKGLIPIFPTKTFPNHYSIATGLYPENHNLISNSMVDKQLGLRYSIRDRGQVENPIWYGGEPIWNTVEKSGKKAGTMFWVGSEAPIQNMRPTFWKRYDGDMGGQARIDSVIAWMSLGNEKEIDFGTLYFSKTDDMGHKFGPDSPEVEQAIQNADTLIGYLIRQLKEKDLLSNTNIIIVSDHGMSKISRDKIIVLDNYIDIGNVDIIESSPSLMMNIISGEVYAIYELLKNANKPMQVYTREDLPERFRLKKSQRVPDLVVIPDIGYTINIKSIFDNQPNYPSGGTHGFDNITKEMQAILILSGPSFKQGIEMPEVENIHLYELMVHLLGIESAGTDGSIKPFMHVIKE